MAHAEKVYILGIGDDGVEGLTQLARGILQETDVLIGEPHCLALAGDAGKERIALGNNLDEVVRRIEGLPERKVAVLADGDPLFYGFARYLCDKLGKDRFEVVPHVSTMQIAFARVKESWEEAFLTNLASHSIHGVLEQIRSAEKVGLFTTEDTPANVVARVLLDNQIDYFTGYVCENLGSPDERVTRAELAELAAHEFGPLSVMVLVRKPHVPDRPSEAIGRRLFGNPDEAFLQTHPKRGLLTPAEVRAIVLAEMDLGPKSVVWDIGAGSGSVAVEAAQIARGGTVYAIEMDPDDHRLIIENAKRFHVENLVPVLGRAPDAWQGLADPDAVFVGGSGRGIGRLVEAAYERLRVGGRLVATMGSIDNVTDTHRQLRHHGLAVKVWMLHFARGTDQMDRIRFESLNPTFMVSVLKPGAK